MMNNGNAGLSMNTVGDAPLSQAEMDAKMKELQSTTFNIPQGPGPQSGGLPAPAAQSGAPMSQAQIDEYMKQRQSEQFQPAPQQQQAPPQMQQQAPPQMQQRPSPAQKSIFALYYSERDPVSIKFLGQLHKTAFFKKFIILCVDKQGIKIPRCVKSVPTIIVPTKEGPRPLAGEMAMKWLEMAKQQSVPGNEGASGGAGGTATSNWTGSGNMSQFDTKVAYGLKPFGDQDQLSSWDAAGSGGYSQGFALWSNNDTMTGLTDNNGAGINSNYTPVGLQPEGRQGGASQAVQGSSQGGQGQGMGQMSGGISGAGSLPGTGVETRNDSTVDQDYEQFMAMRDADPYIGKPMNRQ